MRCSRCQQETPSDADFCPRCGVRLPDTCTTCGTVNAAEDRYCRRCGQPLSTPSTGGAATAFDNRRPDDAERRQLTVMFCDLVGSTALSERLDPEELRTVVRAYQQVCAGCVERFEGYIAQYLGDGVLVYFGYPKAHENEAERAVRAGLDIVGAVARLSTRFQQQGFNIAVRVGIHTGLVVVGEVGGGSRHERLALGDTPNLAARLQALAGPGAVVISSGTHRLVYGFFVCRDLGPQAITGASGTVQVYEVLRETEARTRFDVVGAAGLTRLVGREQETGLLLERWAEVAEGRGQFLVLTGEAGIGKSRLVQALRERLTDQSHLQLEGYCSPYHQNSPLYPIIDLLPRVLRWGKDDTADARVGTLENLVGRFGLSQPDAVPLLASLLSLPMPDRFLPLAMSPERQRQKTQDTLVTLLLAMAAERPVLLVLEDLHWIDPSTLELLTRLLDQVPMERVLVLLTARPPFDPPWPSRSHLMNLALNRLPRRQTELMVAGVVGSKGLPIEVLQQIVVKTDGVPLFVEELTKMVLESGLLTQKDDRYELSRPLPPLAIPSTLRDSLTARLDRLASVKEVAQLAATLGRTFAYDLLSAVSMLDEGTLQRELSRLVEAELLYQRGLPPQATYIFKHALVQDAAYQSLLKSTRQRHHQRIAQALVEQFSSTAETQPELVAHHFTEAGLGTQAVGYWQLAAQRAIERSAPAEAIAHCEKGLEVLPGLPDRPERTAQELGLQLTVGLAWQQTTGWASPEMERTFTRVHELCRGLGDTPRLVPALAGLFGFFVVRGDLRTATALARRFLGLGQQAGDTGIILFGQYYLGLTSFYQGGLSSARAHLSESVGLYDSEKHRFLAFQFGADGGVLAHSYLAHVLWALGYPDQAVNVSEQMLFLARSLSHPFTLAWALSLASWHRILCGEWEMATEYANAAIALAAEQSFPFWSAVASAFRGVAVTQQGQPEEGAKLQAHAISTYRAMGAELGMTHLLAFLADAYLRLGRLDDGLQILAEGFALAARNDERVRESELYRLKGEMLLLRNADDDAYATECFRSALDIARRQQAKSLELRAAMSMSRLLQTQGKLEEARRALAEVYGWFTEGLDTADLRESKILLDELAAA
jgi:TOMM system kinase/cyclase fusion protein